MALASRFSANVELDETLVSRQQSVAALERTHGTLVLDGTPELGPASAEVWLRGQRGGWVHVTLFLTPQQGLIQELTIVGIPEPSAAIADHVSAAVTRVCEGAWATLLNPVRHQRWMSATRYRIHGQHLALDVLVGGDLTAVPVIVPVARSVVP
jgi:hypothetical protein